MPGLPQQKEDADQGDQEKQTEVVHGGSSETGWAYGRRGWAGGGTGS
jgi:hypothetical protein